MTNTVTKYGQKTKVSSKNTCCGSNNCSCYETDGQCPKHDAENGNILIDGCLISVNVTDPKTGMSKPINEVLSDLCAATGSTVDLEPLYNKIKELEVKCVDQQLQIDELDKCLQSSLKI